MWGFFGSRVENCEHAWDGDVFVNPVDYLIFLAMVYNKLQGHLMYKPKCHKTWKLLFCCYFWLPMPSSALYQLCWFRNKKTYFMSVFAYMLVSERLLVLLKITAVFKVELWQGHNCTPWWVMETQMACPHLCRQTRRLCRFPQASAGFSLQELCCGLGSWDEKLRVILHGDLYTFFSEQFLSFKFGKYILKF